MSSINITQSKNRTSTIAALLPLLVPSVRSSYRINLHSVHNYSRHLVTYLLLNAYYIKFSDNYTVFNCASAPVYFSLEIPLFMFMGVFFKLISLITCKFREKECLYYSFEFVVPQHNFHAVRKVLYRQQQHTPSVPDLEYL